MVNGQEPNPAQPSQTGEAASVLNTGMSGGGKTAENSFGGDQFIKGQEVPVFDASNETVDFMGIKYSLMDSRIGGQFTGYLVKSEANIKAAEDYSLKIRRIIEILDKGAKGSAQYKVNTCAELLTEAAKYKHDHGICESLKSSLVMAVNTLQQVDKGGAEITKMRSDYKRLIREMSLRETKTNMELGASEAERAAKAASKRMGVKARENIKSRTELNLNIKKTELENATVVNLAKWQYQSMLVQLFAQRRFEHCLIGCRLYTILFQSMANDLKLEKGSEVHKFFKTTIGVQPTVTGLDAATNEAIGRAKEILDSVTNHIAYGQIDSATKRMIEAYVIGEHLTDIHTFPTAGRKQMHDYINLSNNLKEASEVRNWEEAEHYTQKLRDLSKDFRYIKAITAINSYKNASNASLSQFRIFMAKGDHRASGEYYKQAMAYWPTNPKVADINASIESTINAGMRQSKMLDQKTLEFEDLTRNSDYRNVGLMEMGEYKGIFKQARESQELSELERDRYRKHYIRASEIFEGLDKIETAVRTAEAYAKGSQFESAWEAIKLELDKEHIDETRLKEELSKYSSRASRFRDLFIDAESMEEMGNYGSAMSNYMKARQMNPKSQLAELGINRLLELRGE